MAKFLLGKDYKVFGSSRDAELSPFSSLKRLGIFHQITTLSVSTIDFRSVFQAIQIVEPDEVYNLAGSTSVGLSFQQPVESLESISLGSLYLLEAIRMTNMPIKLYNAGSSECFGNTNGAPANELTAFHPRSPYAVAKAAAFWQVANYREAYDLFACTGILFNHESPLRPTRFVTQKIILAASNIAAGKQNLLHLGNLGIIRDWGWAPEYVETMWLMLQKEQSGDYVVATGESYSLKQFVEHAFNAMGLDWNVYVKIDNSLMRPTEILSSRADASKTKKELGWSAKKRLPDIIKEMLDSVDKQML